MATVKESALVGAQAGHRVGVRTNSSSSGTSIPASEYGKATVPDRSIGEGEGGGGRGR